MRYFVTSDMHSFYTPFIEALDSAGYDKNNPEHTLIICGDVFDRGYGSADLFEFLSDIDPQRLILIKGNHEELYIDLLKKYYPEEHDFHNGTVNTFCQLARITEYEGMSIEYYLRMNSRSLNGNCYGVTDPCYGTFDKNKEAIDLWHKIYQKVLNHPATKWITSDAWKDYYELDRFIFVHSFIPVEKPKGLEVYNADWYSGAFKYFKNWRADATEDDWSAARWGCPWKQYDAGLFDEEKKKDKVLVCGHWHTYDFYKHLDHDDTLMRYESPIYAGSNIIGLDACTAYNDNVNVLVIDNDRLYDKFGKEIALKKE